MSECYQCPDCDYVYDKDTGDAHEGYPPGTAFNDLPEDFACPDCIVCEKPDFRKITAKDHSPC